LWSPLMRFNTAVPKQRKSAQVLWNGSGRKMSQCSLAWHI
jgi:hypothetical protein